MKAILHASAIVPDAKGRSQVLGQQAVLYDELIQKVVPMEEWDGRADEVMDAGGRYVSPGFLNVHIHGCGGKDTMDEDDRALPVMRRVQAQMGVTGFLPTTMTYDMPRIHRAFRRIRAAMGDSDEKGARVLGCHMEGPYISPACKGAQAEEHICKADFGDLAEFADVVKIVTIAPEELPGWAFVEQCQRAGILVSIGHTKADYREAMAAVQEHGIGRFTHLFNAMTGFHHREPGTVGAALDTSANCEIIPDNIHVHPAAQRLVYRAKQGRHVILVTDSLRACGMGDGLSELGGQKVWVKGERATLKDGTLAGSVLGMNRAVSIFRESTGAPLPQVIETVTRNPAEELGIYGEAGSIEPGKRADFSVFDEELRIFATIVSGRVVYASGR